MSNFPRFRQLGDTFHSIIYKDGGHLSIAICRIILFTYLYLHVIVTMEVVWGIGTSTYFENVNINAYHAKSLLYLLFPKIPPSLEVVAAVLLLAKVSTIAAIFGVFTRIAMITSVLSLIFLASLQYAWEPLWSHPYNSGLIAGIGFMFGRAGDFLSIDRIVRERILKRPLDTNRPVYYWPVFLGMFGVATVYFGGFYAKWSTPDFTYNFSWVWSDNLRNSISLPWLIMGKELPWNVDWIVNNPLIWKLGAAAHLGTQALPMLAIFSMQKPWIRLLEGSVFAAGIPLLLFAMGMWNPEWLLLTVFFVDWDHFFGKRFGYNGYSNTTQRIPLPAFFSTTTFAIAFIVINILVIVARYDDRGSSRLFPFSSMNFYSNVAALRPYSTHQHYPFVYGELLLNYNNGTSAKWFCTPGINSLYLSAFSNFDVSDKLKQQYGAIKSVVNNVEKFKNTDEDGDYYLPDHCNSRKLKANGIVSIDLYSSVLQIPSYPTKIETFEVGTRALVGHYDVASETYLIASGFHVRDADAQTIIMHVKQRGFVDPVIKLYLSNEPWQNDDPGPLIPIQGEWIDDIYHFNSEWLDTIGHGWFPIIIRLNDPNSREYDFFGGVLDRKIIQ